MLFDAAKKLVGIEFLLAGGGTAQNADMQNHDVTTAWFDAVQNIAKMIHIKVIADGDQNISRLRADGFRCQLSFQFQVELVHFHAGYAGMMTATFGNRETDVQQNGKNSSGHGRNLIGKKIEKREQ